MGGDSVIFVVPDCRRAWQDWTADSPVKNGERNREFGFFRTDIKAGFGRRTLMIMEPRYLAAEYGRQRT